MMALLVYPASLPGPMSLPQQRAERRSLSGVPGPRAMRALWRDRLDPSVPVTFRFGTLDQAEAFVAWLHTEQIDAGAWFAADWRVPQGRDGVFRFLQLPAFPQWLAPNVWECSGVVEIRGRSLPPVSAVSDELVPCELLLHFDQADSSLWVDRSIHQRALTIIERSGSTIAVANPGKFSLAGAFDQSHPGSAEVTFYNTQAEVIAAGSSLIGADEFFFSAWVKISAYPTGPSPGYVICSNLVGVGGAYRGVIFYIDPSGHVRFSVNGAGASGAAGTIPLNQWVNVAVSRKNRDAPADDIVCHFIDGVLVSTESILSTSLQGADWVVGAYDRSTNSLSAVQHIWGFEGQMDELLILLGDGAGVSSSFTPRGIPYNADNVLPPVG